MIVLLLCPPARAQSTLGTLTYRSTADTGYLLLAPSISTDTWLIDNCGRVVHQWDGTGTPALSAYLLPDGSLLRAVRIPNDYDAGGSGGRIERTDWDGLLLWQYDYASDTGHQHHDIQPLPNGNILVLAWEKHSAAEAIALGRNPSTVPDELWSEKIVELRPQGPGGAAYIWSWRVWDHLVQNTDPTKPNYGNPADFPGRIDINVLLDEGPGSYMDWSHANSVDYHPEADQILLSVRNFHELWIIDHSTTKAQAAGSTGGNSNRGGDLLYRWGNPQAYGRGTPADQVFFQQHDARWIPDGYPGAGNITVFNNGKGRTVGSYSSVEEIAPPIEPDGNYTLSGGDPYGPVAPVWQYGEAAPVGFNSKNLSGAERQRNGNTLICSGAEGRVIEISPDGQLEWEYICPVGLGGPLPQGSVPINNQLFRLSRYAPDFPGLLGRDLSPGDPVQLESGSFVCPYESATGLTEGPFQPSGSNTAFHVFPNPFQQELWVIRELPVTFILSLTDASGALVWQQELDPDQSRLVLDAVPPGLYHLHARPLENGIHHAAMHPAIHPESRSTTLIKLPR